VTTSPQAYLGTFWCDTGDFGVIPVVSRLFFQSVDLMPYVVGEEQYFYV
jgi:hypothetical protein